MKNIETMTLEQENMMLNAQISDDALEDVSGGGLLENIIKKAMNAVEKTKKVIRDLANGSDGE